MTFFGGGQSGLIYAICRRKVVKRIAETNRGIIYPGPPRTGTFRSRSTKRSSESIGSHENRKEGLGQSLGLSRESASAFCVLTGAGISAESGIKTFREAGGLWEDHPIEKVATPEGFAEDPKLVWEFYNARRKAADVAVPNAAHVALARLELGLHRKIEEVWSSNGNGSGHRTPEPMTILTQNIDGLHQTSRQPECG